MPTAAVLAAALAACAPPTVEVHAAPETRGRAATTATTSPSAIVAPAPSAPASIPPRLVDVEGEMPAVHPVAPTGSVAKPGLTPDVEPTSPGPEAPIGPRTYVPPPSKKTYIPPPRKSMPLRGDEAVVVPRPIRVDPAADAADPARAGRARMV